LIELFKKEGFYSHFEAAMNNAGTIVASSDGVSRPIPCEIRNGWRRWLNTDLPDSEAEEAFDRLTRMVTRPRCQTSCAT
jgi:hypothetical protein